MANLKLIATATFGLESIVKNELIHLGYTDAHASDGKVIFSGNEEDIVRTNLWLRTADRILLQMGEFEAYTFDELFEKTKALPWEQWITEDAKFTVVGKSVKSKLYSVPDCQAIVKKAVVEKLKQKYHIEWFRETGPEYKIQISILKDLVTLTIDTSGTGLHKRGYRIRSVEAPLKETLAAALIQISYWNKNRKLYDFFCGSGTIPVEAALIGKNIAPGLSRSFACEAWPQIEKDIWKKEKTKAFQSIDQDTPIEIYASDINPNAIEIAKENAIEAGVDDCIRFEVKDASKIKIKEPYGILISNPPYGERIGEEQEVTKLYRTLGNIFKNENTWSVYMLTSVESFEKLYGKKADKKRKLYNGRIKVDFYQYFGAKPAH